LPDDIGTITHLFGSNEDIFVLITADKKVVFVSIDDSNPTISDRLQVEQIL